MADLICLDTDPEHIHDVDECCECASTVHCCGSCPSFLEEEEADTRSAIEAAYDFIHPPPGLFSWQAREDETMP